MVVTAITVSLSAYLLSGQLQFLREAGFRVILMSSPGDEVDDLARAEGVECVSVRMEREIRPLKDLCSLLRIWRVFRAVKPDLVNAGTPKAGLLFTLAAWLARVPCRIYTLRGFRHERTSGRLNRLLRASEQFTFRLAHRVICIAPSLRDLAIADGMLAPEKAVVIGNGSSNGIDLERFSRDNPCIPAPRITKGRLGIPSHATVVGFVGRLTPDKGLCELVESWRAVREEFPNAVLLLVGPEDHVARWPSDLRNQLRGDPRVIMTGFVKEVEEFFPVMDVFVLPTHREGFGNVLIQAAAMGVPVISTNVTGAKDAVKDGFNGRLVPPQDAQALAMALRAYLSSPNLRLEQGKNGVRWAQRFDQRTIWRGLEQLYRELLSEHLASPPRQ